MIDKTAFLEWIQLPASLVEFRTNGETDPSRPSANIIVTINGHRLRYHVRQIAPGSFILEETSYCVGNPNASFHGDDRTDRDASEFNEASCDPDEQSRTDESIQPTIPADTLNDILAEQLQDLHLSKEVISAIADWHDQQVQSARESALALNLRSVVAMFMSPGNLAMRAWSLAYAAGLDCCEGKSMTEVGRELGVTRAAISKETNKWVDLLGLNRSRYMKSEDARKSYSEVQKTNHWRRVAPVDGNP